MNTLWSWRNSFVLSLVLVCLSSLNACSTHADSSNNKVTATPLDIIVIGAGAAGLSTAYELQNAGHNVVVLEARNRIGGRVWSDKRRQNQSVDLGAGWIHGIRRNPLSTMVKQQDVATFPTDYDNLILRNGKNQKALSDSELERLIGLIESKFAWGLRSTKHVSVKQGLQEILDSNPDVAKADLNFVATIFIEQEYAAPLDSLSVYALQEGEETLAGGDVMFPKGYDQIFSPMAEQLTIRFEQTVIDIDYSTDKVSVSTANQQTFVADKVVVTVPLGVLKKNKIRFLPELPASKQNAINVLGMGVFDKVYLGFPDVFWEKDKDFIFTRPEKHDHWRAFLNLHKQYKDNALLAIITADNAIAMESKTDNEILEELMAVLRELYGPSIPQPDDVRITRWHQDPFAHGAYSYMKVGADSNARRELGKPVDGKLYFAGEATNEDYPATVHGALLSGRSVARLINASK